MPASCSISLGDSFNWLRNKVGPRVRAQPTEKELAVARKEQATSGQGSVFDALVEEDADKKPQARPAIRWVNDTELKPRNADLQARLPP